MIPPRTGVTAGVVRVMFGVTGFTTIEIAVVAGSEE